MRVTVTMTFKHNNVSYSWWWLAGWIGGGGGAALRKHNALGYSCHRHGGIKMTYALVRLCGWYKKKKKSPPTTISEHKNNKRDLCCVAVASISDKLSQWGVNAASLIHGSLSMSFWTAEMSPSLRVLSAPHWTCHHQIIARCLSARAKRGNDRHAAEGEIFDTYAAPQTTRKLSCPNYKTHAPCFVCKYKYSSDRKSA